DARLPKRYWADAMACAAHIISRSPAKGLKGNTPYEVLFGRPVDPTFFRPFGCTAYALIPKDKRAGKFGPKSTKCLMLG
ncbi:hypothetical protein BD310DRAFT_793766, partial [Dichomitus squalens]